MEKDKAMVPTSTKVLILGGGPAGIATALSLNLSGVPFLLAEASAVVPNKIGETLPANCKPILKLLGLESLLNDSIHLPSYGNKFLWGSEEIQEKHFLFQKYGNGWQINRQLFECQLLEKVRHGGGQLFQGMKLFAVQHDKKKGWIVEVNYQGQKHKLHADFIVDASGRAAKFTRSIGCKRDHLDRLIGLACRFLIPNPGAIPRFTHVEADENGWWYAVVLSNGELVVVFMTDADLINKNMLQSVGFWSALKKTTLISSLFPKGFSPASGKQIQTRSANTACLGKSYGLNWLAVGDAAFAYDPISSYGMGAALGSGFYAGQAIADHFLNKKEALPAYRQTVEDAFIAYLKGWQQQYLIEKRWMDYPFWKRRHDLFKFS